MFGREIKIKAIYNLDKVENKKTHFMIYNNRMANWYVDEYVVILRSVNEHVYYKHIDLRDNIKSRLYHICG